MKHGTLVAGMVAVLVLAGCGEEDAARIAGADFYREGETVTSPDGTRTVSTLEAAALPDDFPKDVPQYKGMQLLTVEDDRTTHTVVLVAFVEDSQAKVFDFYKQKAETNGWTLDTELEVSPGSPHLTYHKGDRELRVGFVRGGERLTNIMLRVTKEKRP